MKKSFATLASLITIAGLAGGATLTTQAHAAQTQERVVSSATSDVAVARLHALLRTPGIAASHGTIHPGEGGAPSH